MSEPDVVAKSLTVIADVRKTEMGIEVKFHSRAVNITVEIDLDSDPEFFHAMAANLVDMTVQQVELFAKGEWVPDESPGA